MTKGRRKVAYISYGVTTATRAHNLQTCSTVNALAACGAEVLFINPTRLAGQFGSEHLPETAGKLIAPTQFYHLHRQLGWGGRFWSLFLDRTLFALRTAWLIRRQRIDAVIVRDVVCCYWLTRRWLGFGVPVVYELHTLEQVTFNEKEDSDKASSDGFSLHHCDSSWSGRLFVRWLRRFENQAIRDSAEILALTDQLVTALARSLRRRPPVLLRSGHAISEGCVARKPRPAGMPSTGPVVIYAGLTFEGKITEHVVDLVRQLPAQVTLFILGGEEVARERLQRRCRQSGVAHRVVIHPPVVHSRVPEFLAAADVAVIPYPATAFLSVMTSPIKLFEFLASGLPVVASDLPAIREIVVPGETGLLVPPDDMAAMAAGVQRLLSDGSLRRRMAGRAVEYAQQFSFDRRAQTILQVVEHLLDGRPFPCN